MSKVTESILQKMDEGKELIEKENMTDFDTTIDSTIDRHVRELLALGVECVIVCKAEDGRMYGSIKAQSGTFHQMIDSLMQKAIRLDPAGTLTHILGKHEHEDKPSQALEGIIDLFERRLGAKG